MRKIIGLFILLVVHGCQYPGPRERPGKALGKEVLQEDFRTL